MSQTPGYHKGKTLFCVSFLFRIFKSSLVVNLKTFREKFYFVQFCLANENNVPYDRVLNSVPNGRVLNSVPYGRVLNSVPYGRVLNSVPHCRVLNSVPYG
jgi:hypothetical protein